MKKIIVYIVGHEITEDFYDEADLYKIKLRSIEKENLKNIAHRKLEKADLLVIDLDNLNDPSEMYQFTAMIRSELKIPVIYLSSCFSPSERIAWLNYGVNDYVYKPFNPQELFRKILIHSCFKNSTNRKFKDENFEIDLIQRDVAYRQKSLELTNTQYLVLLKLLENANQIVSRNEFVDALSYDSENWTSRNVDTIIKQLRKLIDGDIIKTARGCGYMYHSNPGKE